MKLLFRALLWSIRAAVGYGGQVLGAVGEIVDDVVVRLDLDHRDGSPMGGVAQGAASGRPLAPDLGVNVGTDTAARIEHRQGGSAANVCVAAVASGAPARFIGQVGADAVGRMLEAALVGVGVEVAVRRQGRTATVVVLCHHDGERTMLTDRGDADGFDRPDPAWLDGLRHLHVPLYSCGGGVLAETTGTLVGWARAAGMTLSLDLSATVLCRQLGPAGLRAVYEQLAPGVVLANQAEAAVAAELGMGDCLAGTVFVVKQGRRPALVHQPGREPVAVAALDLGPVPDSTGAGDAFAGGWLAAALAGADPIEATRDAHRRAAARLVAQGAGGAPGAGEPHRR